MRTLGVVLFAVLGWFVVSLKVSDRLFTERPDPWGVAAYFASVAGVSMLTGFAVGRVARVAHWAGALVGGLIFGIMILPTSLLGTPPPRPLEVYIVLGMFLILPTWAGAWLGCRLRFAAAEKTD